MPRPRTVQCCLAVGGSCPPRTPPNPPLGCDPELSVKSLAGADTVNVDIALDAEMVVDSKVHAKPSIDPHATLVKKVQILRQLAA